MNRIETRANRGLGDAPQGAVSVYQGENRAGLLRSWYFYIDN